MPIQGQGWEFYIVRNAEQKRASDGKRRTVGQYQIYHDGVKQAGGSFSGAVAETRGPGANSPENNNRRVEAGRYPLWTHKGPHYATNGYKDSQSPSATPRPAMELKGTGDRTDILIHPGNGFLSSIGCINPTSALPKATTMIDYVPSRKRVIDIIEDLKAYADTGFPNANGKRIPIAWVVIDGEPEFEG